MKYMFATLLHRYLVEHEFAEVIQESWTVVKSFNKDRKSNRVKCVHLSVMIKKYSKKRIKYHCCLSINWSGIRTKYQFSLDWKIPKKKNQIELSLSSFLSYFNIK